MTFSRSLQRLHLIPVAPSPCNTQVWFHSETKTEKQFTLLLGSFLSRNVNAYNNYPSNSLISAPLRPVSCLPSILNQYTINSSLPLWSTYTIMNEFQNTAEFDPDFLPLPHPLKVFQMLHYNARKCPEANHKQVKRVFFSSSTNVTVLKREVQNYTRGLS